MDWGSYCWNDTKGCCEMTYVDDEGEVVQGRACCTDVRPGLRIVKLPKGGRRTDDE